jgi:hypothetical protein
MNCNEVDADPDYVSFEPSAMEAGKAGTLKTRLPVKSNRQYGNGTLDYLVISECRELNVRCTAMRNASIVFRGSRQTRLAIARSPMSRCAFRRLDFNKIFCPGLKAAIISSTYSQGGV